MLADGNPAPGLPCRGGVGLKPALFREILTAAPDIGFFEVHEGSAPVKRLGLDVVITRIATGTAIFIRHLPQGLGDAGGHAMAAGAAFDLTDDLSLLVGAGAVTAITTQ